MPVLITCPECDKKLKVAETVLGKKVRCPGCSATFPAQASDDAPALVEPVPPRQPPPREDPDEEGQFSTSRRPATPARRPRLGPDDDEPYRRVRKKKSNLGLILGLVIGGLLLFGGVITAVVILVMKVGTLPEADWKEFSPPGGRCTILMPGTPIQSPIPGAGVGGTKYLLERRDKNMAFAIVWFDLGGGFILPGQMQMMSNAERDQLVRVMNATVVSESDINLGGSPGHEVQLRVNTGEMAIMRFYQVKQGNNNRVYQLLAAGPRFKADSGEAARFLDSFKPETNTRVPAQPPVVQWPP